MERRARQRCVRLQPPLRDGRNGQRGGALEQVALPLDDGVDEVALALVADAWSRTYRSNAVTVADAAGPVRTRAGLLIVPDRIAGDTSAKDLQLPAMRNVPAAHALDEALRAIGDRYGDETADLVAMQLELPRDVPSAPRGAN